jgi:hypothetical protein
VEVVREGTLEEAVETHRSRSAVDLLERIEEVFEALEVRVRRTVSLIVLAVRGSQRTRVSNGRGTEKREETDVLSHAGSKRASGRRRRRPSRLASLVYRETVIGWKSRPFATALRKTK